ncbi:sugar transferase [Nocardioides sp. InS609-2]|uniref:sugar transferase n=1 Tax=Nocardioides sp. InS609-2 TaxID=2760705 RepID=UPI0020C001C4|nr:sugar transferase [Nocardioides sp. InS609-2]
MTSLELSVGASRSRLITWPFSTYAAWVAAVILAIVSTGAAIGVLAGLGPGVTALGCVGAVVGVAMARRDVGRGAEARIGIYLRHQMTSLGAVSVLVVLMGVDRPSQLLAGFAAQFAIVGVLARGATNVTAHPATARRVMLVGDQDGSAQALAQLRRTAGCDVVGVGLLGDVSERSLDLPDVMTCALTSIERIVEMADAWHVDTLAVAPSMHLNSMALRRLSWRLAEANVRLVVLGLPDGVSRRRVTPLRLGAATGVEVGAPRPGRIDRVGKAVLDRVAAAAILMMSMPVLIACAVAIRLESPGPAVFKQTRVGRDGTPFTMYKLRSMSCDAEERKAELAELNEGNGRLFKMKQDPRVTRVGGLLRKTSLDELPQMINVMRGEMSLVGPRPALPGEVAQYNDDERRRLAVRPGLTGLWQVSGRSDLSHDESVRLDLEYTDNWDLGEDLRIGLKTFAAVTRSSGAY